HRLENVYELRSAGLFQREDKYLGFSIGSGRIQRMNQLLDLIESAFACNDQQGLRAGIGGDGERIAWTENLELGDHVLNGRKELLGRRTGDGHEPVSELRSHAGVVQLLNQAFQQR